MVSANFKSSATLANVAFCSAVIASTNLALAAAKSSGLNKRFSNIASTSS